jgi:YgiT-type zinc finger domain-containing protein
MICLICRQADIIDGPTSIEFKRNELHFVIINVPARVCPRCGEAYVDEDIAWQLLQIAKEMSETGIPDAHCEYRNV